MSKSFFRLQAFCPRLFPSVFRPVPRSAFFVSVALFLQLLMSCASPSPSVAEGGEMLKYAALLSMEQTDSFVAVRVRDAWHPERTLAAYVLVPADRPLPACRPEGTLVRTPLRRLALTSSVHASLFVELGAGSRIAGLADTAYVVSPSVRALLSRIASLGSGMQPDVERLHALQCDAVFTSPYENAGHGALDALGVPLIECADYMEVSPLARAEWMRFYGRLVGCSARADSLFSAVEADYLRLCEAGAGAKTHPAVFCDLLTGGTWYQPGGASTMGRFIADAGGRYLWADRPESGSVALDVESVYATARTADLWLVKYGASRPVTYASLAADSPHYRAFSAWRSRHVVACNTLRTPFYEEVPFHPERLLRNLIYLFHPQERFPVDTTYYRPL